MSAPDLEKHYSSGQLLERIEAGLRQSGLDKSSLEPKHLGPLEEFHTGGRPATQYLFSTMEIAADAHCLDVGCGIGGSARCAAVELGVKVTGVDLMDEFVAVRNTLSEWVGLDHLVSLSQADVADLGDADRSFDVAWMLHVGMNIEDKAAVFKAVADALRPGAQFGIYDVMRTGDGDVKFPMPWASNEGQSFVESEDAYRGYLVDAGFEITHSESRREFGLEFLAKLKARSAGGPPPLGLHLVIGPDIGVKIGNMAASFTNGTFAPVQMIATRR